MPKLIGDESRLQQVTINLIKNMVKITPQSATLQVLMSYNSEMQTLVAHIDYKAPVGVNSRSADQKIYEKLFLRVETDSAKIDNDAALSMQLAKRITDKAGGDLVFHTS